jgi:hypothetical protein
MKFYMHTKSFIFILFFSVLLINNNITKAENPNSWWATLHKTIFRAKNVVAPENDVFYRNLLKEAGLANVDSISIYSKPETEHCAVGPGPMLLIDEKYFNGLPSDQQRFIMGHEAIHIKNRHYTKIVLPTILLWSLQVFIQPLTAEVYEAFLKKVGNERLKRILSSSLAHCAVHATTFMFTFVLPALAIRWHYELEATREGTIALDCVQGALAYIEGAENSYVEGIRTANVWGTAKLMFRRYFWLRLFHPPLSWHIAEVKKLA